MCLYLFPIFRVSVLTDVRYISTYAYNDEESNELYSEYHLGRSAFR